MKLALLLALHSSFLFAAIDGTVQNATTSKSQSEATITLVELGSGMNTVASTRSDSQGRFHFDSDIKPGTPYLIQALYEGVTYNRMLPPGSPSSGIALEVYEATGKAPDARVTQDMILLERSGDELVVNETVIFTNSGKTTFQSPEGTLKIQVPSAATGAVRMRITAPQGMPITREPERGKDPHTWVVRYPIKPGETRIDFSYSMPASESTLFESGVLHGGGPVRFVAPQGIKLESPALISLGPEPRTQASVYELKGTKYAIKVSGTGQLRAPSESGDSSQSAANGSEEGNSPGLDMVKPMIFGRVTAVVGLIAGMLLAGFVFLYSKGSGA